MKNKVTTWNILIGLNNYALFFIAEAGSIGRRRRILIHQIGVWNKALSLDSINIELQNMTGNDHSNLRVVCEGELLEFRNLRANDVVISLEIL